MQKNFEKKEKKLDWPMMFSSHGIEHITRDKRPEFSVSKKKKRREKEWPHKEEEEA